MGTQESFCKVSDQLDTWLNNYGLISRHNSSINCVNNCTLIFKRHQPRLFLKALLVVHRLQNGTSEDNIKLYLSDNDIEAKGVTKVSNIEAKYASFKVEVKMSSMDTLLAADFWPTGVCVRRFYQSRNTQP